MPDQLSFTDFEYHVETLGPGVEGEGVSHTPEAEAALAERSSAEILMIFINWIGGIYEVQCPLRYEALYRDGIYRHRRGCAIVDIVALADWDTRWLCPPHAMLPLGLHEMLPVGLHVEFHGGSHRSKCEHLFVAFAVNEQRKLYIHTIWVASEAGRGLQQLELYELGELARAYKCKKLVRFLPKGMEVTDDE
jgi:hypothetical protein